MRRFEAVLVGLVSAVVILTPAGWCVYGLWYEQTTKGADGAVVLLNSVVVGVLWDIAIVIVAPIIWITGRVACGWFSRARERRNAAFFYV